MKQVGEWQQVTDYLFSHHPILKEPPRQNDDVIEVE